MFTITCFTQITPEKMGEYLRGVSFQLMKNEYVWSLDGYTFRICPFKNQPRDSRNGYRIYFDGDITGGLYLFDLSIGCMEPMITGVEFELRKEGYSSKDWLKALRHRPSYKKTDVYGIYEKNGVGLIVVNDSIILQIRSKKNKKLLLMDCLKQIEILKDDLIPKDFDLFSISKEEII